MAEAVGLSLAIVGLAGNLKGCIDMFEYFTASKDLGRDYNILSTKLDIEKALLLQWAERVRILEPDYDPRLDNAATLKAVSTILANIKTLLQDSTALEQSYGLKRVDMADDDNQGLLDRGGNNHTTSSVMMQRFTNEFERLQIRRGQTQKAASTKQKFLWVTGGKDKLEELVDVLAHFVARLNQLLPEQALPNSAKFCNRIAAKIYRLMSEQSRDAFNQANSSDDTPLDELPWATPLRERAELCLIRDATRQSNGTRGLSEVADDQFTKLVQGAILRAVWFRTINARRDGIAPPHFKTLEWVLGGPRAGMEWQDLAAWLASGTGTYWVSGKAGSGKSTLMKYLRNNPQTLRLLETWAGSDHLTVSSFFFWYLGSAEQKTQRGLLRGLLHHIIEAHPALIPSLLPEMWREVYGSDGFRPGRHAEALDAPSDTDLTGAFEVLPSLLSEHSIKLCLLIDGLDEFEGNYHEGINLINRLSHSPNIKIVVSSRPIPACNGAFSGLPKLRMQDLNRDDVLQYVGDTLGDHHYMKSLRESDPIGCAELLNDLSDRASGVFLWVVLACRSLLDGFDSCDRVAELRVRMEELPPELEDLFTHMLNKIPRRYHDQTAKLLMLAHDYQVTQLRDGHHGGGMSALPFAILEQFEFDINKANFADLPISTSERLTRCELLEGRLRSRVGGLLELSYGVGICLCAVDSGDATEPGIASEEESEKEYRANLKSHAYGTDSDTEHTVETHDGAIDGTVVFMHRSVFEFLSTASIRSLDCLTIPGGTLFDTNILLYYYYYYYSVLLFH